MKLAFEKVVQLTTEWLDLEEEYIRAYLESPKAYASCLYSVPLDVAKERLSAQLDLPIASLSDETVQAAIEASKVEFGPGEHLPEGIVLAYLKQFNKAYQYVMYMPETLMAQRPHLGAEELQELLNVTGFDLTDPVLSRTTFITNTPALVIEDSTLREILNENNVPRLQPIDGGIDFTLSDKMRVRNLRRRLK